MYHRSTVCYRAKGGGDAHDLTLHAAASAGTSGLAGMCTSAFPGEELWQHQPLSIICRTLEQTGRLEALEAPEQFPSGRVHSNTSCMIAVAACMPHLNESYLIYFHASRSAMHPYRSRHCIVSIRCRPSHAARSLRPDRPRNPSSILPQGEANASIDSPDYNQQSTEQSVANLPVTDETNIAIYVDQLVPQVRHLLTKKRKPLAHKKI